MAAVWMATGGFCGARARRREREVGADGSSSSAHAGFVHLWDAGAGQCAKGGVDLRARDSEPIVGTRGPGRGPRLRARRGFAGSRMGGVGGRSEP